MLPERNAGNADKSGDLKDKLKCRKYNDSRNALIPPVA
jgi:hypothetical protein